jgi:hypothetical protein
MEEIEKKAGDLAHTLPSKKFCSNGVKTCRESHETLLLRGGGLDCRRLGRRLVIWHTTQLEILQDDGAKTGQVFSRDALFKKRGIRL